ncbi:MAG: hypothetical protein QXD43_02405 [Candidatus Aenigmatarchaeota archaeon]
MNDFYSNYLGTYVCEVLSGIPRDKVEVMKSLVYYNGCDLLKVEPMVGNDYQLKMEVIAPNQYIGEKIKDVALNLEYAKYAYLINPRKEEKLKQYIV